MAKRIAQAAQQMRPPVPQLASPDAKLMAGVHRSQRLAARHQLIAGEHLGELGAIEKTGRQTEHRRHVITHRNDVRVVQRLRIQAGIESVGQCGEAVVKDRQIGGEGIRGVHCVGFLAKDWG
jgi:hypothetical protein